MCGAAASQPIEDVLGGPLRSTWRRNAPAHRMQIRAGALHLCGMGWVLLYNDPTQG
jgi:hypothetical protein